jgi:hypothetical protein
MMQIELVVTKHRTLGKMTGYAVRCVHPAGGDMRVSSVYDTADQAVEDVEQAIAKLDAAAGGTDCRVPAEQRQAIAELRRKIVAEQA